MTSVEFSDKVYADLTNFQELDVVAVRAFDLALRQAIEYMRNHPDHTKFLTIQWSIGDGFV